MDDVLSVIEQMLNPRNHEAAREEGEARSAIVARLFMSYRERDGKLAAYYVEATYEIPLSFLATAVLVLERTRVYPKLPMTGELWTLARKVARMDRQQYRAGHYLPPPRDWPPEGKRHAIECGEFETMPTDTGKLLAPGALAELKAGTP